MEATTTAPCIVSDEELAAHLSGNDPLVAELLARTRLLGSHQYGTNYAISAGFRALVRSRRVFERRAADTKTKTCEIARLVSTNTDLAMKWIAWHAILLEEIEAGLVITPDGLAEADDHHMLTAYRRWASQRGVSGSDDDYYLEELTKSACSLTDNIVLTSVGKSSYAPKSVEHAVQMMISFAKMGIPGLVTDEDNSDLAMRKGKLFGLAGPTVAHYDADDNADEQRSSIEIMTDRTTPSTEQLVESTIYRGPLSAIVSWLVDDRSCKDKSAAGVSRHILFGFTLSEKAALKKCIPLDAAGAELTGRSRAQHGITAEEWRCRTTAFHEIARLLYMLGALGPKGSLDNIESLETAVADTDDVYKGHVNGNAVLKVLDAASVAATPNRQGDATQVTMASLSELCSVAPNGTNHEYRVAFEASCRKLSLISQTDAANALHHCEDSFAVSLGRIDPACVMAGNCTGHPLGDSLPATTKGARLP